MEGKKLASLNLSQLNKANGVTEMFCKVNYSTPDTYFYQFLFIIFWPKNGIMSTYTSKLGWESESFIAIN